MPDCHVELPRGRGAVKHASDCGGSRVFSGELPAGTGLRSWRSVGRGGRQHRNFPGIPRLCQEGGDSSLRIAEACSAKPIEDSRARAGPQSTITAGSIPKGAGGMAIGAGTCASGRPAGRRVLRFRLPRGPAVFSEPDFPSDSPPGDADPHVPWNDGSSCELDPGMGLAYASRRRALARLSTQSDDGDAQKPIEGIEGGSPSASAFRSDPCHSRWHIAWP